jgi:hypothetical protein
MDWRIGYNLLSQVELCAIVGVERVGVRSLGIGLRAMLNLIFSLKKPLQRQSNYDQPTYRSL